MYNNHGETIHANSYYEWILCLLSRRIALQMYLTSCVSGIVALGSNENLYEAIIPKTPVKV